MCPILEIHILKLCVVYPEMAILDFNRILVDFSMQWQHVNDKKSNGNLKCKI